MEELYLSEYSKEVTILAGDDKSPVRAHKAVLAICSEIFKKMLFTSGMTETTSAAPVIKTPDIEAGIMETFIKYCYLKSIPGMNMNDMFALLCVAEKYQVIELRNKLISILISSINADNCILYLETAVLYSYCKDVELAACNIMMKGDALSKPNILNQLPEEYVIKIMSRAINILNPDIFVQRLIEYIERHNDTDHTKLRKLLKELIDFYGIASIKREHLESLLRIEAINKDYLMSQLLNYFSEANDEYIDQEVFEKHSNSCHVYHVYYCEETGEAKAKPPIILGTEVINLKKPLPEIVGSLGIKSSSRKTRRFWVSNAVCDNFLYTNYEELLLERFSVKNKCIQVYGLDKIIWSDNPQNFTGSGSIIIEESDSEGISVLEHLEAVRESSLSKQVIPVIEGVSQVKENIQERKEFERQISHRVHEIQSSKKFKKKRKQAHN